MSLLKQDVIKNKQINKLPEPEREFETRNNKKYKVKIIIDNIIYSKEINN